MTNSQSRLHLSDESMITGEPIPAEKTVGDKVTGGIAKAIRLSRAIMRNIRQNPFFGFVFRPIIAGAAMSLSSVSVISNALRLRNVRL
jgi:Cu+-exporting ATPase